MSKIWKIQSPVPQSFLEEHPDLPPIVANLLYNRNIVSQEKIDEFLYPDYSKHIHDPFIFKDMETAVDRIFKAIQNKEKITVHGDYDADGVSASVIIIATLQDLGAENVEVFLPHREIDGYGLNTNTIKKLADQGTKIIITCDCGISNAQEVDLANELGMEVIITDHHAVPESLPKALAIIHPKVDEHYPDKSLAGGGVAFKLAQALLQKYQESGEKLLSGKKHESFEKWLLDMVAIASVADMVPLLGESRTLTKYGLIVLNKTRRIGLQKLLLEARLIQEDLSAKKELTTDTISFQIAPRINAAGRMNHANVAYNLLMTKDGTEAVDLAFELNKNNQDRQNLTDKLINEAIKQIEKEQKNNPVLFVEGKEWSTGIVGLIAGKIKEKYYKPTIVLAINGEVTGSGRSIEGFNLIGALQKIPEFFYKFGGHPMACGFTLKDPAKLNDFKKELIKIFVDETRELDLQPTLMIDAEVDLDNINWELYDILQKFEPFGQGNEKPKYLAKGLTIVKLEPVGKDGKHLRIMVKHNSHRIRKTIGWRLCDESNCDCTNWGKALKIGDTIDLVFEVDVNEWNGNRELQMTIIDLAKTKDTEDADFYANDADNADNFIYKDLTYKINGLLFKVHNEMPRYANEKQICDAIENLFNQEGIIYEREKILPISFPGEHVGRNRVDFLIENKIVLEIKLLNFLGKDEYYQCLRYLESLDSKLGLLVNFRSKQLKIKRIINPKAKILTEETTKNVSA